ncbi:MAG: phosphohydrolase, partial [Firmicutes bacterium]|nr:phosphohydrolase [Bacillota bacterium]
MLAFSGVKNKMTAVLSFLAKQRKVRRGSAAVLFLFLITLLMTIEFVPEKTNLVVGQVSPKTFFAQKSIVFEDKYKTNEQRRLAAEKIEKVYSKDPQVSIAVQKDIADLAGKVREVQGDAGLDVPGKVARLRTVLPFVMSEEDIKGLAQALPKDTQDVENKLTSLVAAAMENGDGITQDRLAEAKKALINQISGMRLSRYFEEFSKGAVERFLRP